MLNHRRVDADEMLLAAGVALCSHMLHVVALGHHSLVVVVWFGKECWPIRAFVLFYCPPFVGGFHSVDNAHSPSVVSVVVFLCFCECCCVVHLAILNAVVVVDECWRKRCCQSMSGPILVVVLQNKKHKGNLWMAMQLAGSADSNRLTVRRMC